MSADHVHYQATVLSPPRRLTLSENKARDIR
jgi:hypothetical protein